MAGFSRSLIRAITISTILPAWILHFWLEFVNKAGLEVVQSRYFGNFSIWLENEKEKPAAVRAVEENNLACR